MWYYGAQSIIDEEGVKMASSSNSKEDDDDNDKDGKNWDQPLIIARPDVEVSQVIPWLDSTLPLPQLCPHTSSVLFLSLRFFSLLT
jgi:hypothetical protein